jgi:hypothetical protein
MVETPSYEVTGQIKGVELRLYPRLILATVAGRDVRAPFRILFEYISGNNSGRRKISMTAPVITPERIDMTAPVISGSASMSFILPAKYDLADVPAPNDERVRIHEVPERTIAVIRFRGWARTKSVEKQRAKLIDVLQAKGVEMVGEPFLMRYNAPYTPGFMRRNEIAIEIAAS